jgi:hypothetical protein
MNIRNTLLCAAALSLACVVGASAAIEVKAPKQVQQALGTLNRVVDHTGRLISAKNYTQLPAENNEFKEGTSALQKTLSEQSRSLRTKVRPMLNKAREEAQSLADAASSNDNAKLAAIHVALANSVKGIIGAFPTNVQPGPPNVAREQEEQKLRK